MSAEEPSVLQQIRKKEVELSVQLDQARRDAEEIVADAKKEAADILKNAEADGRIAAEKWHEEQLASVLEEVDQLHRSGEEEVKTVKLKGERNLSKAIDKIVTVVISG
jgi:V/A-type H+-transporting ATPase subunit G/H